MKTERPLPSPVAGAPALRRHPPAWATDSRAALHALCALRPAVSALRLRTLCEAAGSAAAAWQADPALLRATGWTEEAAASFAEHRARWSLDREDDRLRESGIALVALTEKEYPPLLREIYDPPLALYVRGVLPDGPAVAVVGSRKATPYGRTATHALVRPLATQGVVIVSGLAYGIDAEAHRATLAVRGRTIAVLGGGVDDPALYPRPHRPLAADIIARGGGIVSEFPPGTESRAQHFPQRNRLIAGLARAVLVVEAARASGALITARLALAENREVLAVPGPITSPLSEGTNHLLEEGAAPALSAEGILETLALDTLFGPLVTAARTQPASPSDGTERIFQQLGGEPQSLDDLVSACTLPAHEVSAALTVLELSGRIRDVGGKHYVRVLGIP